MIKTSDSVKAGIYAYLLKEVLSTSFGADRLMKLVEKKLYSLYVVKDKTELKEVGSRKFEFLNSLLKTAFYNVNRGYISRAVANRITETLVKNVFSLKMDDRVLAFEKERGLKAPRFVVLSPTQVCNLSCTGCYASSSVNLPSLPFEIVDRITHEATNLLGNSFMVMSGGEPFMYRSGNRTLFDIWEKYDHMFFLVYTNGTLLKKDVCRRLAELGNVTPAISIEGFEKETDERRGKGTYSAIMRSMENLREAGVLFGTSVTTTSKNAGLCMTDEFYDFWFTVQGVNYMWMFQLMPIGRANNMHDMVTPAQRIALLHKIGEVNKTKGYPVADFWNSGFLSKGCIAYGREGGYIYIDWNGNIMPCVFVPFFEENILDLYNNGKDLRDALFSKLMIRGRAWQKEYGFGRLKNPENWYMPCSIRDHWSNFRKNILTEESKPADLSAREALNSPQFAETLKKFDRELEELSVPLWKTEFLDNG